MLLVQLWLGADHNKNIFEGFGGQNEGRSEGF